MKRVYIIDAHAFLHRSYHALPKFSTSKGEEVGALFGFMRLLLKIVREKRPEYVAVCFDSRGGTFRDDLYGEYKANRKELEPGLAGQLATARDLTAALGLKGVYLKGYEADDLIATLARRAAAAGMEAVIVSGDKDAAQLVGDKVKMWDGSSPDFSGPEAVEKKYGLPPALLPEYFALTGDSSDNVPGVAGVGPKSALKLVQTYGALEKILAAAMDPAAVAADKALAKVARDMENARLSRRLVTLEADAPIEGGLDDLKPLAAGGACLEEMARRLEFKELLAMAGAAAPAAAHKAVELPPVKAPEQVLPGLKHAAAFAAFDHGLAIGGPGGVCILRPGFFGPEQAAPAIKLLEDKACRKSVFGLKAALRLLDLPAGFAPESCFDAEAAAELLAAGRSTPLPQLAFERLSAPIQMPGSDEEAALCCAALPELEKQLAAELEKAGMTGVFRGLEMPLLPAVYAMERHGTAADTALLGELSAKFEKKMAELQAESERLTGLQVNLNSPKQVGFMLYEKLSLGLDEAQKKRFKTKDGYSTGEEVLQFLKAAHPVVPLLLEFREVSKLKSSFVDNLLAATGPDGRLHTTFDQLGTATGRFSSSKPNLQNIPVRSESGLLVRKCFIARPGFTLLSADYSQIDLRVVAHLSGDRGFIEAFKSGEDIHLRTAAEIFHCAPQLVTPEMRRAAKAINFGIVYGKTAQGLSQDLGISRSEAANYIKHYFEACPGVKAWSERTVAEAKKNGYVTTFTGRRRPLPELTASNPHLRGFAERAAVNTPVQGGSAEIIKMAMLELFGKYRHSKDVFMLLQVHDELVFEVKDGHLHAAAAEIKKAMECAYELAVPLVADLKTGPNWRDMKKYVG